MLGNRYVPSALAMLNHFLRDHRTGGETSYDPREFDLLHALMQKLHKPNGLIETICGYRTPWSNNYLREHGRGVAENSQHTLGKAIDIHVPGVSTRRLDLLNRILTEQHGKRIAVIENEFGEVGVDQELVIGAEEEIFEMNNGCICCTMRGDLIRILGNLMKRREKFDYILVETTGMADPGPVAQTFFVDDEMQTKLRLDGIVTLVDTKHVWQHIDDSDEVKEQIAFADVILLNKIDLVAAADLDKLEARIRSMNAAAKIYRTQDAAAEMSTILDVGGFNLDRALEVDPMFMESEHSFEWAGIYSLKAGTSQLTLDIGPDPVMSLVILPVEDTSPQAVAAVEIEAVRLFSEPEEKVSSGSTLRPGGTHYELALNGNVAGFEIEISESGAYALFTEHRPEEFDAHLFTGPALQTPRYEREYKPDHEHDEAVSSVGITTPGDRDKRKFNRWMSELLQTQGTDIFRMKGVLSLKGEQERFVFQGVHMLFDGRPDRLWNDAERHNQLIFIGRNLDRSQLNEGFRKCLA